VIETGELTVAPFAGVQITTPAVVGALQPDGGGGGGALPTVKLTVAVCNVPVLSHAFTVSLCVPAAAVAEPDNVPVVDAAACTPSTYAFIDVIECPVPVAAAEMATGEPTVEPFAGEQMTTPAEEGGVHAANAALVERISSTEMPSSIPSERSGPVILTKTPTQKVLRGGAA
jgi:hypothetical protein